MAAPAMTACLEDEQRAAEAPLLAAEEIDIRFIAASLAKLSRPGGRFCGFYSAAQHAVLISRLMPLEGRGYGLLDGAHRAYVGQLSCSLEASLKRRRISILDSLMAEIDGTIHRHFGLDWPLAPSQQAPLLQARNRALATEIRDLGADPRQHALPPGTLASPSRLKPLPWDRAEELFLAEFQLLFPFHHIGRL